MDKHFSSFAEASSYAQSQAAQTGLPTKLNTVDTGWVVTVYKRPEPTPVNRRTAPTLAQIEQEEKERNERVKRERRLEQERLAARGQYLNERGMYYSGLHKNDLAILWESRDTLERDEVDVLRIAYRKALGIEAKIVTLEYCPSCLMVTASCACKKRSDW